jgi:hypothetical protein
MGWFMKRLKKYKKVGISAMLILMFISMEAVMAASGGHGGGGGGGHGGGSFGGGGRGGMGGGFSSGSHMGGGAHMGGFSGQRGFSNPGFHGGFSGAPGIHSSPQLSTSPRMSTTVPRLSSSAPRMHSSNAPHISGSPRFSTSSARFGTSGGFHSSSGFNNSGFNSRGFNNSSKFNHDFDNHGSFNCGDFSRFGDPRLNTFRFNSFNNVNRFHNPHQNFTGKDGLWPGSSGGLWYGDNRLFTWQSRGSATLGFHSGFNHLANNQFAFRDFHNGFHQFPISSGFRCDVRFGHGRFSTLGHFYPWYHNRYCFVSLGGYWPGYPYYRYYQYGWYPYSWYGYNPVPYQVPGYGYYTYDYPGSYAAGTYPYQQTGYNDYNPQQDYNASQQEQQQTPMQTTSDILFDSGVKNFENGNYDSSARYFLEASRKSPDDVVVPFAYVQSLFASKKYTEAAGALRAAVMTANADKEGVFFPRGLYTDDKVLYGQINELFEMTKNHPTEGNLQLLLGYQFFGIGENDNAIEYLQKARSDTTNRPAAEKLLSLVEKNKEAMSNQNTDQTVQPGGQNMNQTTNSTNQNMTGPSTDHYNQSPNQNTDQRLTIPTSPEPKTDENQMY